MAKYREIVCKHYVCFGVCKKGRDASQAGYCQRCDKYEPRAKEHHVNQKKRKLEQLKAKMTA